MLFFLFFTILILQCLGEETLLSQKDYFYGQWIRSVNPSRDRIPQLSEEGLFEGDIEMDFLNSEDNTVSTVMGQKPSLDLSSVQHNAFRDAEFHWPRAKANNNTVDIPFTIDTAFNAKERAVLAKAIKDITSRTCVRFINRNQQRDYLHIEKSRLCSSWVGKVGGKQIVKMSHGCMISFKGPYLGVVQHELMHALGFWHEHSRPDRDAYVDINWKLIPDYLHVDYIKKGLTEVSTLNLPYDYSSIMHYKGSAGMRAKSEAGEKLMGNREVMSSVDAEKINALYKCNGRDFSLQETVDSKPKFIQETMTTSLLNLITKKPSLTTTTTPKPTTRGPDKLRSAGFRPALWTCYDTHIADCEELKVKFPNLCLLNATKCACMSTCELCNVADCEGKLREIAEENAAKFSGFCSDFAVDCDNRILAIGWDRFCRNLVNKCQCRASCNACSFNRCPAPGVFNDWGFGPAYRIADENKQ